MRMRYKTSAIFFGLSLVLIVFACDTFLDDSIPASGLVKFNQTDYFVTSGNSVIINLESVIEHSWVDAELVISQDPAHGTLRYVDSVTLKYTPAISFPKGKDAFVISVLSDGTLIKKETFAITVITNAEEVKCDDKIALYAFGDRVYTKPDSPVTMKFLANDRLCGVNSEDVVSSIYLAPENGTVVLAGDSIVYTPASGYTGKDSIVYVISDQTVNGRTTSDNQLLSYASIEITISDEDCFFAFPDYYILDLTDDIVDPMVTTEDCGTAYKIFDLSEVPCPLENSAGIIYISESNNSGFVCFGLDYSLTYLVDPEKKPKNDFASYNMCLNGICKVVVVYVIREPVSTGKWSVVPGWLSTSDEFDFCLFFTDEQTGFVGATNLLLKTTNGGISWKNIIPDSHDGNDRFINDIHFLDTKNGYAIYTTIDPEANAAIGGGLLATSTGGQTWEDKPFEEGLISVYFTSALTGFVSKRNIGSSPAGLYKTSDGGVTWKLVTTGSSAEEIRDIGFINSTNGYAASRWHKDAVLTTSDGGDNWSATGSVDFLLSMTDNGKKLFAATGEVEKSLWSSSDGGATWSKILEQTKANPSDFAFSPGGTLGIQVGSATINGKVGLSALITNDSGVTWKSEVFNISDTGTPNFHNMSFQSISIPSESVAYAIALDGMGFPVLVRYNK